VDRSTKSTQEKGISHYARPNRLNGREEHIGLAARTVFGQRAREKADGALIVYPTKDSTNRWPNLKFQITEVASCKKFGPYRGNRVRQQVLIKGINKTEELRAKLRKGPFVSEGGGGGGGGGITK